MCGIVGMAGGKASEDPIRKGLATLVRRGPDARAATSFSGCVLGHARLSIIDLATGNQPMRDDLLGLTITFNGEIYNYKSLRKELERAGHIFLTTSDTEVILKAYGEYGESCVEHLDGMFAFAIWDEKKKRVFLARDRFGEKPLYYALCDDTLIFASEIKAILATGLVSRTLDHSALDNFLALYYIPPWRTIYHDITPLPPAHRAVFEKGNIRIERYWSITRTDEKPPSFRDAALHIRALLEKSVESRMVADVEVGVFLSGGIDSSVVTALAKKHAIKPLKSFAAGFENFRSELPYAREVAKYVGTEHYERDIPVSFDDFRAVAQYFDEPFADSSNVPTHLLSSFAREKVKVTLSGDGGDEIFFGYGQYRSHRYFPKWKKLAATLMRADPFYFYKRSHLNIFSPSERRALLKNVGAHESDVTTHIDLSVARTPLQKINLVDMYLGLPGDMLTKVDRASMMHSLEVRSPFLQHDLAQFVFNLPDDYKTSKTRGKLVLAEACKDLLPSSVFTRKKEGFGAPVRLWLKEKAVHDFVRNTLTGDPRLSAFLHTRAIEEYVDRFYSGEERFAYRVWMLLFLELWLQEHAI